MDPTDIFATSLREGYRRLARPWADLLATGFLGALAIVIGSTADATTTGLLEAGGAPPATARMLGAVFFPLGFFLLLQVRAELFTENFLVPVNAVLEGLAGPGRLLRLWAGTLLANLGAGIGISWLVALPGVLPASTHHVLVELAEEKAGQPLRPLLVSAILGGFLLTVMTLAMLRESVGAWMVVFAAGYLLAAGGLQHVVVSTIDIWMGIWSGAPVPVAGWLGHVFLPTLLMNMVGGLGLATLPHYLQVYHRHKEALQDVREEVGVAPPRRRL